MALSINETQEMPILSQQLLLSLVEELKMPFLQIARRAEQGNDTEYIRNVADNALHLIDNYTLGVRLATQPEIETEAINVSSVLYDTGHQLSALAKSYGVELELNIAGRFGPVMANREGLQAALTSLGAALIEALPAQETAKLKLQLATHRCRYGIVAGLYASAPSVTHAALERGKALQKTTRQPFLNISHTSGAGIFVADAILKAMNLTLKASRHHRLYGLGAVLKPNYQIQLV